MPHPTQLASFYSLKHDVHWKHREQTFNNTFDCILGEMLKQADTGNTLKPATADEAASLLTEMDASDILYKMVRLFCKERGADLLPEYNQVVAAKKRTYPPAEANEVSESADVKASLQAVADHTVLSILEEQGPRPAIRRRASQPEMSLKVGWRWLQ